MPSFAAAKMGMEWGGKEGRKEEAACQVARATYKQTLALFLKPFLVRHTLCPGLHLCFV